MTCSISDSSHVPATPPVLSTRFADGAQRLSHMTTIGVGGEVKKLVNATSEDEIIEAVQAADEEGLPLLLLGGGSNILASDDPFPGVVIRDARHTIRPTMDDGCGGGEMIVTAGTPWDETVVFAIEHGWMGLEALSGIPGSTGAAPVQNIGAYGQEVAETLASVRVYDRLAKRPRTLFRSDLKFGYRNSVLKESMTQGEWGPSPRWIVLEATFHMHRATLSRPVRYGQLATLLGIEPGERAPSTAVRDGVLELRRSKGMVLDDSDRDTFSLGSFFTNPVLTEEEAANLPEDAPKYAVTDGAAVNQIGAAAPKVPGQVKTSAAWLIDHAGFKAGYGMPGPAALSTKHCLALTNRSGASADDIAQLARTIRDGVEETYGVRLVPEPMVIGLTI